MLSSHHIQTIYSSIIHITITIRHSTIKQLLYEMPTTTDKPLEGLPVNGVFPLTLSPAFKATLGKGKGAKEDVIGLKCTRLSLTLLVTITFPILTIDYPLTTRTKVVVLEDTLNQRGADGRYIQTRINHPKHSRSIRHG